MTNIRSGWTRLSLSGRIIVGLVLGVLVGLFFGESAGQLMLVGDIYIRLMQMTVLPYLMAALIIGLGQLELEQAKQLAWKAGLMLLMIWLVMIVVLFAMPMSFPAFESASFFSSSLVEPPSKFSITEIYFTANPFQSMSLNVIPAVVLFSCLLGVALIRNDKKDGLLTPLRVWSQAIVRITEYVIKLTPYGVFALSAATAGTMRVETFVRLEAYFMTFAVASLLLAFVILPLVVTALTPFRYREVVGIAKDALLTAFVTHSVFIVLPLLVKRSKELFEKHGLLNEKTDSAADVIIPVLFNFPNAGKLMTLLFIPFVAWMTGAPLMSADYTTLFAAGIPSYFAKAQIALPYLLDLFGLPHDMFRLYIPTTIITGKFDSLVGAMNLLVFAMIGAAAMGGFLSFDKRRILRVLAVIFASLIAAVLLLRVFFNATIDTTYRLDESLKSMHASRNDSVSQVVDAAALDTYSHEDGQSRLQAIVNRGTIRIGFDESSLPFAFYNSAGELVGFDVEVAKEFAASIGVSAEFVPVSWNDVIQLLDEGVIDVMPGTWYRPNWFGKLRLSNPYINGTMGLAVRDERRHEFADVEELRNSSGLRIGVSLDLKQSEVERARYFGDADVEFVLMEHWRPFFEGEAQDLDAFLLPAEHASGWSLLHPEFTPVVPQPDPVGVAIAFGLPLDALELADAANEWAVFASNSGTIDSAYDYWILGKGAEDKTPRWSILHDVFGYGRQAENSE